MAIPRFLLLQAFATDEKEERSETVAAVCLLSPSRVTRETEEGKKSCTGGGSGIWECGLVGPSGYTCLHIALANFVDGRGGHEREEWKEYSTCATGKTSLIKNEKGMAWG